MAANARAQIMGGVTRLGILRDHTPDSSRGTGEKIWSDLRGDAQRPAEMAGPSRESVCA